MSSSTSLAWAQTGQPPSTSGLTGILPPAAFGIAIAALAVALVISVLVILGVRLLERHNRRDAEATQLQDDLAALFHRDPALRGLAVRPIVTAPWRGAFAVELTGEIPSVELHARVVRAVERYLALRGLRASLLDRVALPSTRPDGPRHRRSA